MRRSSAGGDEKKKSLAILVTSEERGAHLLPLARAAQTKDIELYIHLVGPGVRLIQSCDFTFLLSAAKITLCRESVRSLGLNLALPGCLRHLLVAPRHMLELVTQCDRTLLF